MDSPASSISNSTAGDYSLQSQLNTIRGKLFDVNKSLRDLEFNMLFLLAHPEVVSINPDNKQSSSNQSITYNTNRIEVDIQHAEYMTSRYDLMLTERDILAAIYEKKQEHELNPGKSTNDENYIGSKAYIL